MRSGSVRIVVSASNCNAMTYKYNTNVEPVTDADGRPYPDCLIIDQPDLKSRPLILGEGVITIFFWGFWFYLWLPLVSLLAWWLGYQIFYRQMVELGGFSGFIQQLNVFTSGVALVSGAIAIWSFYNLKRYGSYNRRNRFLETDMDQLADTFSIPVKKLPEIQQAKRIVFIFAEDDSIKEVDLPPVQHT